MRVTVEVDDSEVLSELTDEQLLDECEGRGIMPEPEDIEIDEHPNADDPLLLRVYYDMRKLECPESLREYLSRELGRIL